MPNDPLYNEIDTNSLEAVRRDVVWNNIFVDTPFQAKLRRAGVWEGFLGGAGMTEVIQYGRAQGAAVNPGQTVTLLRQQIDTKVKFFPKLYVSWFPMDEWEMDDGSGQGGVINSGPSRIADLYGLFMENMVSNINTMVEMDSFRHGQSTQAGFITDNRIKCSNGLDEALNNGIDTSLYGNRYTTYGGQTRNGNVGINWNATPLYLGTSAGAPGQIDVASMQELWSRCTITGGKPTLGITNVFGFKAIAIALDAQRRDINLKKHDLEWVAFSYNGVEIYQDPLAPSAVAQNYIPLGPANAGAAGNSNLVDGVGQSTTTIAYTTPQFVNAAGAPVNTSPTGSGLPSLTTIQAAEALYFLEPESFKIRPTNKPGFRFGIRRVPQQNNVSVDGIMMRLGINLYNTQVRHNNYAFGFSA
jgi:hypothetical protein